MKRRKTNPSKRISFITLGVSDLDRSREFYSKVMKLKLYKHQGDIVMFDTGGQILALYPRPLLAEDAGSKSEGSGFSGITLAMNVARKTDVDRAIRSIVSRGGKEQKPAEDKFWGGRSGYVADPDGHLWEIAWNPHIPLNRSGSLKL